jgi:DnaJ-domain-containing protein 1
VRHILAAKPVISGARRMLAGGKIRSKLKTRTTIKLKDGSVLNGHVYCSQDERLSDLLNSDKRFLPFETMDGEIIFVTKDAMSQVMPKEKIGLENVYLDPYGILSLPKDASLENIKEAYHAKVRAFHPDRLTALELPDEIISYATDIMARINEAYQRLLKQAETHD